MNNIKSPTNEYFAGHFDGEGYYFLYFTKQNYWQIGVAVGQCYYPILERYKERFGGHIVSHRPKDKNKKLQHCWSRRSKDSVLSFLTAIEPFSHEKHKQILVLISWVKERQKVSTTGRKGNELPESFHEYSQMCVAELKQLKKIEYNGRLQDG